MVEDRRLDMAHNWLRTLGVKSTPELTAITGDASNRRYFRLQINGVSRILMDSPAHDDSVRHFVDIDRRLRAAKLQAPDIIHADIENGFLILEDFGDEMYRGLLNEQSVDQFFPDLFKVLKTLAVQVNAEDLPLYDAELLRTEMDLFPEWYLGHHKTGVDNSPVNRHWDDFCDIVISSALEQPQCFVHRDFHSCNLLKTPTGTTGIIDFQDAVKGPLSYDFISLIWDRYIYWPRQRLETWMESFRQSLGLEINPSEWQRYCDLMGLQRNIKVVGIFARLYYRDGKSGYLEMIPGFYDYVLQTLKRYPEFSDMLKFMEQAKCAP